MEKYQYDEKELHILEKSVVPFAIYQFVNKRVVTLVLSDGFCKLFGFEDKAEAYSLMDNNMYRDTHPDDIARIADSALKFAIEGGEYNVVYRAGRNGKYRIIKAHGNHFYTETGERLAAVWYSDEGEYHENVKEDLKEDQDAIIRDSNLYKNNNYDFLTGLPSMAYFFELAEAGRKQIRNEGDEVVFIFINLSGMKSFNQKNGFSEGDRLIRAVARTLVKYFRNENCSRFGVDHFVAYTKADGISEILDSFLTDCKEINDGKNLPVRVGVYTDKVHTIDVSTACDRAKMAADISRGTYVSGISFFDDEMLKREENKQYFIDNLDKALECGWIKVFHQPIIRAANGYVCDEEAVTRWCDPVRGNFDPSSFIPILEEAKLVYKIDLYVTEQIISKILSQEKEGLFVVSESVNLSRSDFESCDIVEEIRKRADNSGIAREKITIEITESIVGSDVDYMKKQIERFQELGFKVWMDDYGSGYSSPKILQAIPFDTIKLDMQFMRQFYESDKSKIILTEIVRMAMGLGIETVAEGVESQEQADFLKEIGCTKLQGFYYGKPIPFEEIIDRNRKGIQIGFENPEEAEYYSSLGKINLYDMSFSNNEDESIQSYFNTMPMVIGETDGKELRMVRCNKSYREFMKNNAFHLDNPNKIVFADINTPHRGTFVKFVKQCAQDGRPVVMSERMQDGDSVHFFIRRVAVNPVTGVTAIAVVIIGTINDVMPNAGPTYSYVAEALSADYVYLFYVNLDTENFIEYTSGGTYGDLSIERHGEDFFSASRHDAKDALYPDDVEPFVEIFTKENIVRSLNQYGSFTYTYRLMKNGEPVYVNMKIVRIKTKGNHIMIGVNNVDAQMKHQEALERVKEERITYARISALTGDYLYIYTVDPENDRYMEYSAKEDDTGLGLAKTGENFFKEIRKACKKFVYLEDIDAFLKVFTKDKILRKVARNGFFTHTYRLMIKGEPVYVLLKVAMVNEKDGQRLIVGISNIDEQVKRDQEYAYNLSIARNEANTDVLTGVKNKHAYVDMEAQLDKLIEEESVQDFALVVFDLNGLKDINDNLGHQAGDEFIRRGCALVCSIFRHSPVFRIGGDEFVVIAQGNDYKNINKLMELLRENNERNKQTGSVVIAGGMARFQNDTSVAAVFERADAEMYQNKKLLKEQD